MKQHKDFVCPVVHELRVAEAVFHDMRKNKIFCNAFEKPKNLSMVTTHNYNHISLFENSLEHLGLQCVTLNRNVKTWKHEYKIEWVLEYLENECSDELIFWRCGRLYSHRRPA